MKIIFKSEQELKDFTDRVAGCPSLWKLPETCGTECGKCWGKALESISEIQSQEPIPDGEEQHNNDLIFAKRILKARIMCGERETQAKCTGDCDGCRLLYESGTYAEMIHAYQIAIQCIEREERLRKWLTDSVKTTTSA